VEFRMQLAGFLGMLLGMQVMSMRGMRMVRGGLVIVVLVVLSGFTMVVRSLLVMFSRLFVMFGDFSLRHSDSPIV
jgi:hypothetical protein